MKETSKNVDILKLAEFSPVLAINFDIKLLKDYVVIESNISSKDLGIINTNKGLKTPKWFYNLKKNSLKTLIIKDIDLISIEEQEKFYEILKYKTVSGISLGDCKIILMANDINKVSPTITNLCLKN